MALIPLAGVYYPYVKYGNGIPAASSGIEVFDSALKCLLRTFQRSRVMRPTLGNIINQLIFENTGPFLQSRLTQTIVESVADAIPEMTINFVNIQEQDHLVSVWVGYSVQNVSYQVGPIEYGRG